MQTSRAARPSLDRAADAVPPQIWFGISAVFHYVGPSFAVLLFPLVGVLGIAWFRIATAALTLAPIARPVRSLRRADARSRRMLISLGACFAAMNTSFYFALSELPMSLVAAMEFVATVGVALWGLRTVRNFFALGLTAIGVALLVDVQWSTNPAGLGWATANAMLFAVYIVLGHRAAQAGAGDGIRRLGTAMALGFLFVLPLGLGDVLDALDTPWLILAGAGVGVCSSVVPYICDQMAMSRLPRASFALLLALLPAVATVVGAIVLAQIPSARDLLGVAIVMAGVAVHRPTRN